MTALPASTLLLRAKDMTEAMMGPTQGVHTRPRLRPRTNPLRKPRFTGRNPDGAAARAPREPVMTAKRSFSAGTSITRPKASTIPAAIQRNTSALMPRVRTKAERVSVNAAKLNTKPVMIP